MKTYNQSLSSFNPDCCFNGQCSLLAVDVGPEVLKLVRAVVRNHGWLARLPSSRAHLSVFISECQGLDEAQNFVSTSADWEVVHAVLTESAFLINDVGRTESGVALTAVVFDQAAIVTGDASVDISEKRDVHLTNTTSSAVEHGPALVDEYGVTRASDDLTIVGSKLSSFVVELGDLCRADERKVEGVEEQNHIFACIG